MSARRVADRTGYGRAAWRKRFPAAGRQRAQGPAMAVAGLRRAIARLQVASRWIATRPSDRPRRAVAMASLAHDDDAALATALGHWGDPGEGSQRVIISSAHRLRRFGEQRGEDDPSNTWQGSQDRHVALLGRLSRRRLLLTGGELAAERIEATMRFLDLSVDQLEACRHGANMRTGGLDGAGGHGKRLLAQDLRRLCRRDPPDAVRLENAVDTTFVNAGGLGRRRHRAHSSRNQSAPRSSLILSACG